MKKRFIHITSVLALFCGTAMAQDTPTPVTTTTTTTTEVGGPVAGGEVLKSKRGASILPEAGDWSIGISATGTLRYFGNAFSGATATNNAAVGAFDYTNNPGGSGGNAWSNNVLPTLFLKKFIDSKTAYRMRLSVNVSRASQAYDVVKDQVTPDVNYPLYVQDVLNTNNAGFLLALGKEMRRGSHRIQGVYGAEVVVSFLASGNNYTYGNSFSSDFNNPTTAFTPAVGNPAGTGQRAISRSNGNLFFIGARAFIGAEYFFAPKMSIGGEFGYTLGYSTQGNGTITTERYDAATNTVVDVNKQINNNASRFVGLSPDNLGGSINLLMYF